jgi:hypothetical protein
MTSISAPPDCAAEPGWTLRPSTFSVVRAVTRRLVPYLIEATIIPMAIFYVLLATFELRWALVGALCWSYLAVIRRILTGRAVPALLALATLGITARTVIFLLSSNSFVYFVQPIFRTVLTAAFFAGSVLVRRPLIARFASDFCPISPDVQCRPEIIRLFRRLTYLWAGVNATAAAASLMLLLTVPVAVFVGTATLSAWVITCSGVVLTVSDSVRTAHSEGLVTAVGPNGALYAYVLVPLAATP